MNDNKIEIPDFSGDDFANDKGIQEARRIVELEKKLYNEACDILKSELNLEEASHKNLKSFYMFKSLEPILCNSFRSTNSSFQLQVSIAEYASVFPTAKTANSGTDKYIFGCIELKNDYPVTYICKETIREKITNLFLNNDTDFNEHKKFSRRFHVVTKDSKKLSDIFQFKNLDDLITFSDMEIEFRDKTCLFRNSRRAISPSEASEFSELANSLIKVLR